MAETPGAWLRAELARRDINVRRVAGEIDVSTKVVYDWINDKSRPKDEHARALASLLDLTEAVVRAQLGLYVSPELIELARRQWRVEGLGEAAKQKHEREVLDDLAELGRELEVRQRDQ